MQRFLQFVFLCLSAIVVNAIVNPWFLIVAIPIVIIYYGLQRFYRFSSRLDFIYRMTSDVSTF